MPNHSDLLKKLAQSSELNVTVTGRKSGREISNPVWFVLEGDTVYLLPVKGSQTQWYKNLLKNPAMRIEARGAAEQAKATIVTDTSQVKPVVEKFRGKYGPGDVKKYYSNFDVAVEVKL